MTLRTLLVDDEPLALERLQVFFRDIAGAEIVGTARDGREAAEAIERLKPDLALLDIQMPE
ncbi:MAG: two-component system, LytTR family, response regulator, partial [Sphingomonadales bacterium]|nr:two-component system, LytTR family, response regulator [Sphingomonadales bacterium]